jgi:hypothetical protein
LPNSYTITITDTTVNSVSVDAGDSVTWHNSTAGSVRVYNLPDILSPTPPGAEFTLAAGADSSSYRVNGSKNTYTYNLSIATPDNLPATGTISID